LQKSKQSTGLIRNFVENQSRTSNDTKATVKLLLPLIYLIKTLEML